MGGDDQDACGEEDPDSVHGACEVAAHCTNDMLTKDASPIIVRKRKVTQDGLLTLARPSTRHLARGGTLGVARR